MEAKHFRSASGEVARDIVECKSFGIMTESPQEVFRKFCLDWESLLVLVWRRNQRVPGWAKSFLSVTPESASTLCRRLIITNPEDFFYLEFFYLQECQSSCWPIVDSFPVACIGGLIFSSAVQ